MSGRAKVTKVVDIRDQANIAGLDVPQQQVTAIAELAERAVTGCALAVVVAFVRGPNGNWLAETAFSGTGPADMTEVVAKSLHAIADAVGEQMGEQAADYRRRSGPS